MWLCKKIFDERPTYCIRKNTSRTEGSNVSANQEFYKNVENELCILLERAFQGASNAEKKLWILVGSMFWPLKVQVGCKTDIFHWIMSGSRIRLSDDRSFGRMDG